MVKVGLGMGCNTGRLPAGVQSGPPPPDDDPVSRPLDANRMITSRIKIPRMSASRSRRPTGPGAWAAAVPGCVPAVLLPDARSWRHDADHMPACGSGGRPAGCSRHP